MKKTKFILGVVAATAIVAMTMTGCDGLTLNNESERSSTNGYAVKSIALDTTEATKEFVINTDFSFSGLKVTATYVDDSTQDVSDDVTVSAVDTSSVGTKTVTVSYGKTSLGKACDAVKATYDVEVTLKVTGIALKDGVTIYTYNGGTKALYASTAQFTATYSDSSTKDINLSEATFGTVSNSKVTITYSDVSITVDVTDKTDGADLYNAGVSVAALYNLGVKGTELVSVAKDYEVGASDYSASWVAGKDYALAAGNTQTLYFVNYGSGAENWNNFLIEFWGASGVTLRADNYGWNYAGSGTVAADWDYDTSTHSTTVTDWASWNSAIHVGALVKVVVEYTTESLTFTCTSNDSALSTWTQIYKFTPKTDTAKSGITWHLNCDGSYMVVLKDKE